MKKLLLITLLASNTMLSTWKDFTENRLRIVAIATTAVSGCYSTYYGYAECKQSDKTKKINGALSMAAGVGTIALILTISGCVITTKGKA